MYREHDMEEENGLKRHAGSFRTEEDFLQKAETRRKFGRDYRARVELMKLEESCKKRAKLYRDKDGEDGRVN